jgi:uncharacterized membrane protein YfcA
LHQGYRIVGDLTVIYDPMMETSPGVYLLLCLAAALGGAINSIAGGGTLVTFPVLMFALKDIPGAAIIANATNTVSLCPGSLSAAWGYRREVRELLGWARWLAIPSLLGGILGSIVVVRSPESSFRAMVPWLIGAATLLFILQPYLTLGKSQGTELNSRSNRYLQIVFLLQLVIGFYGGYFGAGIGILMLSSLSLLQIGNIHHVNGLKTILAGLINGASVVVFIQQGVVYWKFAIPMVIAASIGGWLGAAGARTLDKRLVRRLVITIGLVLTVWYFSQTMF